MTKFIEKEKAQEIQDQAQLLDVVQDYIKLSKKGSSHVGDCPCCNAKEKFNVSQKKDIWKCWVCEESGVGATSFLIKTQGHTYPEAIKTLAEKYNIPIEEKQPAKTKRPGRKMSFRDKQLRDSGISVSNQKYQLTEGENTYQLDRYQSATKDAKWNIVPSGDDMILHYLDLEGKPMMYIDDKGKQKPLIRVRWANPNLHRDKNGKPMKYQSPAGSTSGIWIPGRIISAYKSQEIIETLYIVEGEKKADKMCQEGIMAVGIMGIHNFAKTGEMPYHFELLIKKCGIANVVFILDSDWQDISIKPNESVDNRPKGFYRAVQKFRDYFKAYYLEGIEIEIFFGHGKDKALKGIDDLLVRALKDKEEKLKQDLKDTMQSRDGNGIYVNIYKITDISTYKLKEYWDLHSNPAFLDRHEEELKKLREFKFGNLTWRWNEEEEKFELAQKILPQEQYWRKIYEGNNKEGDPKFKYQFNYINILEFLRNRGFGIYEYSDEKYRFIHTEGKIVKETSAHKIQRFVMDFTREIEERPVLELLLRGGEQYLGPKKLQNMYLFTPAFNKSDKATMYLYFKNGYWKITSEGIEQRSLNDLPRHIWADKIIDFEPQYIGHPMAQIERKGNKFLIELSPEAEKSHIAKFYLNSSWFSWKKRQTLAETEQGEKYWASRETPETETPEDAQQTTKNLVSKMIAAGYVLHDYIDYGNAKAVICMDGNESEVGSSQGGTGKSVWAKQFKHLVPMVTIDGKKKNIEDDNHIYENVDERTQIILFDDVRVNFSFEFLFSHITTGLTINEKGVKRYTVEPKKFVVTTNHALNGEGNSFDRRQYHISFSDYYNSYRTLADDFGCQLFHEWEHDQWNLFYNWIATCIQTYLKFGLEVGINKEDLDRRKLRQKIGENFLDWASIYYHPTEGEMLNNKLDKDYGCAKYLESYQQERKYMNPRKFKKKLQMYGIYAGLDFNPGVDSKDGRIKSNGREYLVLANEFYGENSARYINSDADLSRSKAPF
jgi:DNA primase